MAVTMGDWMGHVGGRPIANAQTGPGVRGPALSTEAKIWMECVFPLRVGDGRDLCKHLDAFSGSMGLYGFPPENEPGEHEEKACHSSVSHFAREPRRGRERLTWICTEPLSFGDHVGRYPEAS